MSLNKKVGNLLDSGLNPNFVSTLTETQISFLYSRLLESKKKETKEATTTNVQKTSYSKSEAAGKSFHGVTTINPDGSVVVTNEGEMNEDDSDEKISAAFYGITQDKIQEPGSDYPGSDRSKDTIDEKFESKAQQGLFWARCNKCKNKNCKWCKMADEFSKSTSKKQYKTMPEKKHPEKTVKYKKKETKEGYIDNVQKKVTDTYAKKLVSFTPGLAWGGLKEDLNKIIESYIEPTMKKRDLLKLIESEIKNKKGLNEDFYMGEMDEEFDFDIMSDVETAPIVKPKIKPKTPETEPEWTPDEDEPIVPSPNVDPEPQAKKKVKFDDFKDEFDKILNRMDKSEYKPFKYRKF